MCLLYLFFGIRIAAYGKSQIESRGTSLKIRDVFTLHRSSCSKEKGNFILTGLVSG